MHFQPCKSLWYLARSGALRVEEYCCFMMVLHFSLLIHLKSNKENIKLLTILEPICLTMQSIWILWPAWKWESLNYCQAFLISRILLFENLNFTFLGNTLSLKKKVFQRFPLEIRIFIVRYLKKDLDQKQSFKMKIWGEKYLYSVVCLHCSIKVRGIIHPIDTLSNIDNHILCIILNS